MRYPFCVHRTLQEAARSFEGLIPRDYFPTTQRGKTKARARVFVLRLPLVLLRREYRIQRYSGRHV